MKWTLKRREPVTLWEEDGDLQLMKEFFESVEPDVQIKEQMKQSIKLKALEKMALAEAERTLPKISQAGLVHSIRIRLRALLETINWKYSISAAALVILVIIGQRAINETQFNFLKMGHSSNQSTATAPKMANMAGAQGANATSSGPLYGDMAAAKGVEQRSAALYSSDASTGNKDLAILPVPPDQGVVPPADAGLPRKITHNLSLTLQVPQVNDVVVLISQKVQSLQGYVVASQQSGSDSHSSAQLTVKIPADKLSILQDSFSTWGTVLDQQLLANDITNQYYDTQSRLDVLEAEEKRYLEILNQAKTVEEILNVENALGNVRQQIESLKGQLKLWNNQVDYSTVTVQLVSSQSTNLNVQNPWQPVSWGKTWKATGDAALKTLSSTWNAINYLVVGIGYALPYLVLAGLAWILYRLWKKKKSQ